MILYACSSNPGKLKEFALLAPTLPIQPLPQLRSIPPPDETGATFEENARLKALYYSAFTPELVFADDSGLEVDALSGAPGVHSARYAGPHATGAENNALLLGALADTAHRSARFVCVIALARQGRVLAAFRASVEGQILHAPRGGNGFGYDPLFFYPPFGCSFAELSPERKFAISHRGHALGALAQYLAEENFAPV